MSRLRLVVSTLALALALAAVAHVAARTFPLLHPAASFGGDLSQVSAAVQPGSERTVSTQEQPPLRIGGSIKAPMKIKDVHPTYPPEAREARVQGVVIIAATVGPDGKVSEARVLRSIPMLDEAALEAVRQWEYAPALLNGQPVPVTMTVTVNFTLDDPSVIEMGEGQLVYPAIALAVGLEGTVVLDVVVAASGRVASVKVVSGPSELAQAAVGAVRRWSFPRVGTPHAGQIEVAYTLKDGQPDVSYRTRLRRMPQ